jgi:3-phosphoshikimate 1-carboxyvinyltransferase
MKSIPRITSLSGSVEAPSSKSLTARAFLLAAMAGGETTVERPLDSDDPRYLLDAIRKIGFETGGSFRDAVTIGERKTMSANEVELFVGNAGTAMRFLAGWLAFTPGRFVLRGDTRMHQRPIEELVDALRMLDSEVDYLEKEGFPPISIRGRKMRGGFEIEVDGDRSSQFVSALMMGGASLHDGMALRTAARASRSYIDLTAAILRDFGVEVEEDQPGRFRIRGPVQPLDRYVVEGDWSSASYWLAAGAILGEVTVTNLRDHSAQGDRAFLDILTRMGAETGMAASGATARSAPPLRGGSFDCTSTPDIVPTLAAIAPLASSPVEITGIAHLRIKESDRIAVLASELRKLGARVEEGEDRLRIEPGWNEEPASIDPHGDHRIAMAFAIAGLARGNVSIENESVVGKSYPRFWKSLEELLSGSPITG